MSKGRENAVLAGSSKNVRQQNKSPENYEWEKFERQKDGRRRSNHDLREKGKMAPKYNVDEEYSKDEIKEYTRHRQHSIAKIDEEHA